MPFRLAINRCVRERNARAWIPGHAHLSPTSAGMRAAVALVRGDDARAHSVHSVTASHDERDTLAS